MHKAGLDLQKDRPVSSFIGYLAKESTALFTIPSKVFSFETMPWLLRFFGIATVTNILEATGAPITIFPSNGIV